MSFIPASPGCAVFLSGTGFPEAKTAYVHKLTMLGLALLGTDFTPVILSKSPTELHPRPVRGTHLGIPYIYFGYLEHRDGTLGKVLNSIRALRKELAYLRRLAKRHDKVVLITSIIPAWQFLLYRLITSLLRIKFVSSIMELHTVTGGGFAKRFNAKFFDYQAPALFDGVLPISHYLEDLIKSSHPGTPTLIVPVLADFTYSSETGLPVELGNLPYFLFCAGIGYLETIEFVIEAFRACQEGPAKLVLVISGYAAKVDALRDRYRDIGTILILSGLPYDDLFSLYAGARALLIPMRELPRDAARFPQKIAEYLSSGRPVITNAFGEIPYYFTDRVDAHVISKYDPILFAEAMDFTLRNPAAADEIGRKGRETGYSHFHYENIRPRLTAFFASLWNGTHD